MGKVLTLTSVVIELVLGAGVESEASALRAALVGEAVLDLSEEEETASEEDGLGRVTKYPMRAMRRTARMSKVLRWNGEELMGNRS